ncbi:MAG: cobalamin B12-binding domain-containing protein [Anaerolineales bacterium]|nr:cobalamin B12-binding domain-containing protein [Anaerolineales bacterium]MDW8446378.1 cobalamin B12-binding domain-containing protein [Anaerolineales bacterium]
MALKLIQEAVAQGISIQDIYEYLSPAYTRLADFGKHSKLVLLRSIISPLQPNSSWRNFILFIFQSLRNGRRMVAACVANELHEIGLRMVVDFFKGERLGYHYLGANTPPSTLVDYLESTQANLLAISTTIPIHIRDVEELIRLVRKSKVDFKILTEGYP